MFPWLGIHLLEFHGDYRVEMLKQQITRTDPLSPVTDLSVMLLSVAITRWAE
jgi:hypothetical protein